jgi:hypothetical protein
MPRWFGRNGLVQRCSIEPVLTGRIPTPFTQEGEQMEHIIAKLLGDYEQGR